MWYSLFLLLLQMKGFWLHSLESAFCKLVTSLSCTGVGVKWIIAILFITLSHVGKMSGHHYSNFAFIIQSNAMACAFSRRLYFVTLFLITFTVPCNFISIFLKLWLWKEDTALLGSHWCCAEHNYCIFICWAAAYPVILCDTAVCLITVSQV